MKKLIARQSDLSLATGVFFLAGAAFSYLTFTVFWVETPPRNPILLAGGCLALVIAIAVFVRGARFTLITAAVLISLTAGVLLLLVVTSLTEIRALNSGVLFLTLFIYAIWFMPRWLARVLGYTWLSLYTIIVGIKYEGEIDLALATLVVTSTVIGELIGRFKDGIEAATLTDPLCGVWNLRGFQRVLDRAVSGAARTGEPVSMLFIDLDGFKAINDTRGHAEGDRVLVSFAHSLEEHTRPQDTLARIGGDEFALLLPGTHRDEAHRIGQRLRNQVTAIGWSLGAAELDAGETPQALVARADELMLQEKRVRQSARADASDPA